MPTCDAGPHSAALVKAAVVDGKFGDYCMQHISGTARKAGGHAAVFNRDRDAEDHRKDMLQPWINGKPNGEFIRAYPEEAAEIFNDQALEGHDREYN
jgi:hypothetical protein